MFSLMFDYDGPVFTFLRKVADVIVLHWLWLVTSLPIVTIGASTTALYAVAMERAKGGDREVPVCKTFFAAFRAHWKQATVLWLLTVAAAALLAINLLFWNSVMGIFAEGVVILCIGLCIPFLLYVLFVWPTLAYFGGGVKETAKNAILYAYGHPLPTIKIAVIWVVVILLNLTTVMMNFITLAIGFGAVCCLCAKTFRRSFDPTQL